MEHPSNDDTQALVYALAEQACMSLFEAYGVPLQSEPRDVMPGGEGALTGIIGFTGIGITGMVLLAASEAPLRASNPTDGPLRDWMAELSNQLAGRLKHKLLAQGAEVYITTPIVLRATRIEPLPRKPLRPCSFRGGEGSLALWVEVDTTPQFVLSPPDELPVAEGETLLF
ncbi:MAG TPA: chemotaxis protein CheX [Polyangiales bacterium]|nr:chemotaxis protein CheX [Polyangiales bacterium]